MNRVIALWRSAIGKKIVMAVSGVVLVLFLISHMISNVTVFFDPVHLDNYGRWLRSLGPLLWVARLGLIAMAVLHITAAWQLTTMARAARPDGYQQVERQVATYAARTMRWGGVLLLAFIVFHLLHLTFGTLHPDFHEGEVGRNLITGLQPIPVALFYAVSMVALGAHFWHGIWSVFQTLGVNHPDWNRTRRATVVILTLVVAGGFLAIPLGALFGVLTWPPH